MTEDICARENLARQQGCIEAMQDDISELKEGIIALRRDSQETWKVVNRIEAKIDAESQSPAGITFSFRQVVILATALVLVILMLFGFDIGVFL